VRDILNEVSARKDWPTGSAEQLAGDFYAACMDETAIDAAGAAEPLVSGAPASAVAAPLSTNAPSVPREISRRKVLVFTCSMIASGRCGAVARV